MILTVLGTLAQFLQTFGLGALLLLLPFSNAAIEISFGFLLIGWLLERILPQTRKQTIWVGPKLRPLRLALIGFLFACALSLSVSRHPLLSVQGLVDKWLEYLLFFVIVADVIHGHPRRLRWGLLILSLSASLVVVEAVSQEVWGKGWFRGYPLKMFTRMTGPYENPIDLAIYLMVMIPILWAYANTQRAVFRWMSWGLLAALVLCLARTEAAGTWWGLSIGMFVVILKSRLLRWQAWILLTVVLLSGGIVLVRIGQFGSALSISELGKVDRWMMWQAAIGMIRNRPWLGQGLNTFMANYLDYWVGGERQPRYAHNCYLQVAAETGLIGLGLFLCLLWFLFTRISPKPHQSTPTFQLLLGFFGALIAYALHAGIDTDFYSLRQATLFWTMAGLALGLHESAPSPAIPLTPQPALELSRS